MKKETSWKQVGSWYDALISKSGHTYHKEVIFPELKKWYQFKKTDAILDLGCGQRVLARQLPKGINYIGIDAAQPLIEKAKIRSKHQFLVADATKPLPIKKNDFSHVFIILALQNMKEGENAIFNGAKHLRKGGKLIVILNHPCFRIPRQSSWGIDERKCNTVGLTTI